MSPSTDPAMSSSTDPRDAGKTSTDPEDDAGNADGQGSDEAVDGDPKEIRRVAQRKRQSKAFLSNLWVYLARRKQTEALAEPPRSKDLNRVVHPDGRKRDKDAYKHVHVPVWIELDKELDRGCFGAVFKGRDTEKNIDVAIKIVKSGNNSADLTEYEAEIMKMVSSQQGFAHFYHYQGASNGPSVLNSVLVMELLSASLKELQEKAGGKFEETTAAMVAQQLLRCFEYLHSQCIVHRDVKSANMMIGTGGKIGHVYLTDFGLSKEYYDKDKGKHHQMRTKLSLTGTARYASINAHRGIEQSRRDDLEALGHVLLHFVRGSLPWSGLEAKTQEEKYRKIREKKEEIPLMADGINETSLDTIKVTVKGKEVEKKINKAFVEYLGIVRGLDFQERPDYDGYCNMFEEVAPQDPEWITKWENYKEWSKNEALVPLGERRELKQPDQYVKKRGCGLCGSMYEVDEKKKEQK